MDKSCVFHVESDAAKLRYPRESLHVCNGWTIPRKLQIGDGTEEKGRRSCPGLECSGGEENLLDRIRPARTCRGHCAAALVGADRHHSHRVCELVGGVSE